MANAPIILFHGDKGGVGKSFATKAYADYLIKRGIAAELVDADVRNPDVSRVYPNVHMINLKARDGWIELVNVLGGTEKPVVVSLPAGVGYDMAQHGETFWYAVNELQRPVSMVWTLNRERDSIILLSEALKSFGDKLAHKAVLTNEFFGAPAKFVLWNESKTRETFVQAGGQVDVLPELPDRVAALLAEKKLSFLAGTTATDLGIGDRLELKRWFDEGITALFDRLNLGI